MISNEYLLQPQIIVVCFLPWQYCRSSGEHTVVLQWQISALKPWKVINRQNLWPTLHLRPGSDLNFINCLQQRHELYSCCRPKWAICCPQCIRFPVRRRCLVGWGGPRWGRLTRTCRPRVAFEGSEDGLDVLLSLQPIKGEWLTGDGWHSIKLGTNLAVTKHSDLKGFWVWRGGWKSGKCMKLWLRMDFSWWHKINCNCSLEINQLKTAKCNKSVTHHLEWTSS